MKKFLHRKSPAFHAADSSEFDGLGIGLPLLRALAPVLWFTDIGQRLSFSLHFTNFVRFAGLFILNRNHLLETCAKPFCAADLAEFEPSMVRAYLDMMLKNGLMDRQGDCYVLRPQYREAMHLDFQALLNAVRSWDWRKAMELLPDEPPYSELKRDFLFVFLMVAIRYGAQVDFHLTRRFGVTKRWGSLAAARSLFYEVVKSGTVLDLLRADLRTKIPSDDSDEIFFTNLGRLAFNSFTEHNFTKAMEILSAEHTIRNALDVGCGFGDYISILREKLGIQSVTGVERQPAAFEQVKERFAGDEAVRIIADDVLNLGSDERFDAVLVIFVLFYFSRPQKEKLFRKLASLLSDNGVIVVGQYYPHTERLRKAIAMHQGEYSLFKKVDLYFANQMQYAEVMLNATVAAFGDAERWNEFEEILDDAGLEVCGVTNADMYYYAFFIAIKKKSPLPQLCTDNTPYEAAPATAQC